MKLRKFDDFILEQLQDQDFASGYLQDAIDEGGIPLFLIALKQVIEAKKGIKKVAEETGIVPEIIDMTLSENGDPNLIMIDKILHSLGLKLSITS